MYLQHFGLREYPFQLTPNSVYFYGNASHQEALNVISVALRSGEGFIKITGDVGTGKTMLCRYLLGRLSDRWVTGLIPNPALEPDTLREVVARELRIPFQRGNPHDVVAQLQHGLIRYARQGRRVLLCIDEAQTIPDESLEAVRLLTNLETERRKLLHVLLLAQPQLDHRLAQPHLEQLRQRCTFAHRLEPLPKDLVADYLHYRVHTAGYRGAQLFSPGACRTLAWSSRGIPRTLHTLAHKSLMVAWGKGAGRVRPRHVRRAIRDTDTARQGWALLSPRLAALGLL